MNPSASPVRRRKRPQSSLAARFWWVGIVILAGAAGMISFTLRPTERAVLPLDGYVTDVDVLSEEYRRFYGKPLPTTEGIEQQFEEANRLMLKRDLGAAVGMLEGLLPSVSLPLIYNDLGVLYAGLKDHGRTVTAFREALARDASYRPVRDNLDRFRAFVDESVEPLSHEIESNDGYREANHIAVDKPVQAIVTAQRADVDSFRFTTPPPPRDILAIEVLPADKSLNPAMKLFDGSMRLIDTAETPEKVGEPLRSSLVPPPNAVIYIEVWGAHDTAGPYTLKVHPTRSYDKFEPNDDIFAAPLLPAGTSQDAGIMDADDTDFYSFVGSRTGPVTVEIRNRSTTLVPALTTFDSSRRNTGFGPDVKSPGASLRHTFTVEAGRTYYLQVWSQAGTSGNYSIALL